MRFVTFDDYPSLDCGKLDWVVPNLIPKPGILTVLGAPKAGKSLLTTQLALAIAKGEPWHGFPTIKHRVLYLQFDTSAPVWKNMLVTIRNGGISLEGPLYIPHPDDFPRPFTIVDAKCRDAVNKLLEKINPDVVILDVLREMHNFDENDSTQMKTFGDYLEVLFKGRTVIQVHHTKKLHDKYDGKNPVNAARGSSYTTGKCDTFWLLHNNKLYITPRFTTPMTLEFERTDVGFFILKGERENQYLLPSESTPKVSLLDTLRELVVKHPTLSKSQVYDIEEEEMKNLGVSRATFFRKLAGWTPNRPEVSESPADTA